MSYFEQDFTAEKVLLQRVRTLLSGGNEDFQIPDNLSFQFDSKYSRVCISLFQEGQRFIRFNTHRSSLQSTIKRIAERLKNHSRFADFEVRDENKTRILFEMITEEKACDINKVSFSSKRYAFEPGINGLKASYGDKTRYFLPTDAVVKQIKGIPDILQLFAQKLKIQAPKRGKKALLEHMKSGIVEYKLLKSVAFVTYQDQLLPLLRGYPMPLPPFSKQSLYQSIVNSVDWLVNTIRDNGQFTYFYNGIEDSTTDLNHPNDPDFYNMLRHAGATIALSMTYEISHDKKYLQAARKAIDYSLSVFASDPNDNQACYPMCANKAKLGGAGITLVAFVKYYMHTQDESLLEPMQGLARHIISRIQDNGEFLSYYIHPAYNEGQPIQEMEDEARKRFFSFYYPGEAMLGVGLYYNNVKSIDAQFKQDIYSKCKRAMDFLVEVRPQKYPELFQKVPNDAWLMQSIEEWVKVDGFAKQSYYDFLFKDGKAISDYMLQREDSPSINIGARAEGIIAAYYAAEAIGETEIADELIGSINKSVKGLMKTYHTPESTYAHLYPKKSIGTFSFRMTEQWIRIDTIQHTAVLLIRLYLSGRVQEDPIPPIQAAKKKAGEAVN